jgi:hypothetical protein
MDFVGGVYNRHDGGVCTSSTKKEECRSVLECSIALYRNNTDDSVTRDYLREVLLWSHDVFNKKEFMKWCRQVPKISLIVWMTLLKRYVKRLIL